MPCFADTSALGVFFALKQRAVCMTSWLLATCVCRYESWRRQRLSGPKFGSRLKRFLATTVLPVALAVYVVQKGINVKQVRVDSTWQVAGGTVACPASWKAYGGREWCVCCSGEGYVACHVGSLCAGWWYVLYLEPTQIVSKTHL